MNATNRVKRLMDAGTVSAEEGARLLATLSPAPGRTSAWDFAMNPFDRLGGGLAASLGLLVAGVCLAETSLGARFDGVLDLHTSSHPESLGAAVAEQAMAWLIPALLFWGYARTTTRHVRLIDFVGVVGLARIALLPAGVMAALCPVHLGADGRPAITPLLMMVAVLTLPFVAWFLVLLFRGFKNASGLDGTKLKVGFGAGLLVAEVVSKLLLRSLPLFH